MLNISQYLIIFVTLMVFLVPLSANADLSAKKPDIGLWKIEDCKKISEGAGLYLYLSGMSLEAAEKEKKSGHAKKAKDSYKAGLLFSVLSANAAKNFEVFCKK